MTKLREEIIIRKHLVSDLFLNYPQIQDIDYDTMMNMDLVSLGHLIEQKKMETRMTQAARSI